MAFTRAAAQRLIGEPGKYDAISVLAASGVSQTELVRAAVRSDPTRHGGTDGRRDHRGDAERDGAGVPVLRHLPADLRRDRAAGGRLHDLQYVLDHGGSAHPGERATAGARGQPAAGARVRAARGARRRHPRPRCSGSSAVSPSHSASSASSRPSGSTSRPEAWCSLRPPPSSAWRWASASRSWPRSPPPGRPRRSRRVTAMQEGATGSTGYGSKQRVIVGAAVLGLGLAALLTGLFRDVEQPVAIVGAGALLVFFGVSILGRTISLPLSRVLGAPLPRLRGVTGALARENAMRNPKRTAASASALMIGVGVVGLITIFVSSTKASMDAAVDRAFTGDIVVGFRWWVLRRRRSRAGQAPRRAPRGRRRGGPPPGRGPGRRQAPCWCRPPIRGRRSS